MEDREHLVDIKGGVASFPYEFGDVVRLITLLFSDRVQRN